MDKEEVLNLGKNLLKESLDSLSGLLPEIGENFFQAVQFIKDLKGHLVIIGLGKSGLIGQKLAATFASTGTSSFFVHASEALHGDLGMVGPNNGVLLISHSGETQEILSVAQFLKSQNIPSISITGNHSSTLARLSTISLCAPAKKELCPHNLSPTTSTLCQLLLGDLLAMVLINYRHFSALDFARIHPAGSLGRRLLRVESIAHKGESLPFVHENTDLQEALQVLSNKGFGVVIVTDNGKKLTGILCDGDIRRLFCSGKGSQGAIKNFMTPTPRFVFEGDSALDALELMQQGRLITVLPVLNSQKEVVGILHMHDLVKAGLT